MTRSEITRILLTLAALASLALPVPAAAHSYLRSSDPADGAVLVQPPRTVVLTFTDALVSSSAAMTVTSTAGAKQLRVTAAGSRMTADWPTDFSAGQYRVDYRVASQDGHVMQGGISFRIKGPGGDSRATGSTGAPTAVPYAEPAEPGSSDSGTAPAAVPAWVWALGGAVLLAGGGVALAGRRRG